jgi:hypothetical protein
MRTLTAWVRGGVEEEEADGGAVGGQAIRMKDRWSADEGAFGWAAPDIMYGSVIGMTTDDRGPRGAHRTRA